ncbi:MAG: hypothetical protein U0Q18_22625 [Bryobacteraceae bacterium]
MKPVVHLGLLIGLLLPLLLHADLDAVKNEPNLEKRSKLALDNAFDALKAARTAYGKGDMSQVQSRLTEVRESVEVAETSLRETGKNPRKSPKWFKRAEIETRDLLRQMDAFDRDMNVSDRPMLDPVRAKIQQVHDDLLLGVMEGKNK